MADQQVEPAAAAAGPALPSVPPAEAPGRSSDTGSASIAEPKAKDAQHVTDKQTHDKKNQHDPSVDASESDAPDLTIATAESHNNTGQNNGGTGCVEAKNPFDDDDDGNTSTVNTGGGGAPDAESASIPVHNEAITSTASGNGSEREIGPEDATAAKAVPLPPSAPTSPSRPAQAKAQASPFPKFEPYRPHNPTDNTRTGNGDKDDHDDEFDEDEWTAFEDGFREEDVALEMPGLGVTNAAGAAAAAAVKPPLVPAAGNAAKSSSTHLPAGAPSILTMEDIEICQRLDEEFDRALEERDVAWTARYSSVRQCACLSLTFMAIYLVLGTWYFSAIPIGL